MSTRITVREICQRLKLSEDTVYELLNKGIIPAIRPQRMWIISRHAYEQWERAPGNAVAPVELGPAVSSTIM